MLTLKLQQQLGTLALDIDLTLPAVGVTALFGRSGAGKTSLINLIAGLSNADHGRVAMGDRVLYDSVQRINLKPEQRRIGYVFQDARLFPHYSVRGNLTYGSRNRNPPLFDQVVSLLGIESLLARQPATLSGGEQQRVAIGRALLSEPDLLLMDEPLASLDQPRKQELLPWLERLAQQVEIPMLYVSHSLDEILHLADRLVVLANGKVQAAGPLHQVWQSNAMLPWVRAEEQSSLLKAHVRSQHPDYPMTELALGGQPLWVRQIDRPAGTAVRLRIYAHDISISLSQPQDSSIRNTLSARISHIEHQPELHLVTVTAQVANQALIAQISPWAADELHLRPGQQVFLQLKSIRLSQQDWATPVTRPGTRAE